MIFNHLSKKPSLAHGPSSSSRLSSATRFIATRSSPLPTSSSTNTEAVDISRRSALLSATALLSLPQLTSPLSTHASPPSAPLATAPASFPRAIIGDNLSITRVIKGCWQLSGGHRGDSSSDRTSGQSAIEDFSAFYNAGITSWDCADHYGPAEALIGRYLSQNPAQVENIQVLTKLCVFTSSEMASLNKDYISRAVDRSLSRIGTPSVDLMQLYWGDYRQPKFVDATLYLSELKSEGKVRNIGLTNFDTLRVKQILASGVKVAGHQVQYSLLDTRPENQMVDLCLSNNVALLPYGVLAGGFLSDKYLGVKASQVTIDTSSKGKYSQVIFERGGWGWFQELLRTLDAIAREKNSTISNVAAAWVLDKPSVAGVILGARNSSHVADHVALAGLKLDDGERKAIEAVLSKGKRPRGDCYQWERGEGAF